MVGERDTTRAGEAARHRRLFELLNQGQMQAKRLPSAAAPAPHATAMEDFADMARRSLATLPDPAAMPRPPRRLFWQR